MTDPLSLNLASSSTATAGSAAALAGESATAGTGFDALLSAQIVATAPASPASSAVAPVSTASPAVLTPTPGPALTIPPTAVAMASPMARPTTAAPLAPLAPQVTPPATSQAAAPLDLPPAGTPVAAEAAVAGTLPESGKALPAKLPRNALAATIRDSKAGIAPAGDGSAPKGRTGDESDDTAPSQSDAAAQPVLPGLVAALVPAAAVIVQPVAPAAPARRTPAMPRTAAPISTDGQASERRSVAAGAPAPTVADAPLVTRPLAGTAARSPDGTTPATASPATAFPAPVSPSAVSLAALSPAAPSGAGPAPVMISGIAVAIAGDQPALAQAAALPPFAAAPTSDRRAGSLPRPADYALSIRPLATTISASVARDDRSAAPGGQGDLGHGQPPMADPSLTSPAGPSPVVSPEATRGPATPPIQPMVPIAAPLPQPVAVAPAAHDMTALVDRLVEARAAARSAASPLTVTTAVRHAEFGSVSMRFDTAGDQLSVTLASSDPGFAPAAQAALASQQLAPAGGADASSQQNPQRQHASEQAPSAFQPGNTGNGGFAQNQPGQQQPQGQPSQSGFAAAARQPGRATTSADSDAASDPSTNRPGVFA